MNKQVEELVKRVSLTLEEIIKLLPVDDGYPYYKAFGEAVAQAQLNKVLNDPDLYTIAPWNYSDKTPTIACISHKSKWWGVIPLGEVLKKEAENGNNEVS